MSKLTRGPLIVNGYTVPVAEVVGSDSEGYSDILLNKRMAWSVRDDQFDHIASLVANAYAIGLGLPCHPNVAHEDQNGELPETVRARLMQLHAVLRPVRAVQLPSAPEDKV